MKEYTKVNRNVLEEANLSHKKKAINMHGGDLGLAKRMEQHTEEAAFITVKDHHEDFKSGKEVKCRLIKPSKADIGKISKQ